VPQQFAHRVQVHALHHQQRREGVAHVVPVRVLLIDEGTGGVLRGRLVGDRPRIDALEGIAEDILGLFASLSAAKGSITAQATLPRLLP
jgi:hypothetical protein